MTARSAGRPLFGWLAIPALLGVLALVGMALSTESKDDFQERTAAQSPNDQPGDAPQQTQDQAGGEADAESQPGQTQADQGQRDAAQERTDGASRGDRGESQPVIIRTPDGDVVVELGNGDTVRAVPGDSAIPTDPSRTLSPSADGDFGGIRVTEDGTLEPIEAPELDARDFDLGPGPDGGLEVTRADGSSVTVTPTEAGELTGFEAAADGSVQESSSVDGDITVQPSEEFPAGHQTSPDAQPLIIQTERGPVRIELTPQGDLVADQPDPGSAVEIDPDDLVAIRVGENGELEVVPLDEVGPNDSVLVPADGGVDLVRPDGSRVEFRLDGENDGITATEITADGEAIELTPNPDGSVTLEDGTTVGPIDFAEDGGTIERLLDQTADLPWPWVFGAIALLAALSIGTAIYLYRTRPDNAFDFSQLAGTGVDVDEFEHFCTILLENPDPPRAIRLAFYAAERGLGGLPARRQDETPFEWHHRVGQLRPDLAEPLGPICDRFAMVRFAPGQATAEDRDAVVARLRQLQLLGGRAAQHHSDVLTGV